MPERVTTEKKQEKAADICRKFDLGDEAKPLLRDNLTPDAFVALLEDHQLYDDALQFMAHRLSPTQAVWWGSLCFWKICRPNPKNAEQEKELRAIVQWLLDPSEDNRRAAGKIGEEGEAATPTSCLALAAFWSGGNIAPAGLPEVRPGPFLTAQTIAAALRTALAEAEPARKVDYQRSFLQLGAEVAKGVNHWKLAPEEADSSRAKSQRAR